MASVLPIDSNVPRLGHEVTVTVGQPLDVSDITCRCHVKGEDQQKVRNVSSHFLGIGKKWPYISLFPVQVWADIAIRMQEAMLRLEKQSPPNPYQRENPPGKPGQAAESLARV